MVFFIGEQTFGRLNGATGVWCLPGRPPSVHLRVEWSPLAAAPFIWANTSSAGHILELMSSAALIDHRIFGSRCGQKCRVTAAAPFIILISHAACFPFIFIFRYICTTAFSALEKKIKILALSRRRPARENEKYCVPACTRFGADLVTFSRGLSPLISRTVLVWETSLQRDAQWTRRNLVSWTPEPQRK